MCKNVLGDFGKTGGGLMPWKGQASLVNQAYLKPAQETKQRAKDAAAQAAQMEAERQATISKNVAGINSAFAGREGQYTDFENALRESLGAKLGQQRDVATRQNKFALARNGLTGGSAAIDAGRTLARENQEGVLNVEHQAQAGAAGLRSADEDTRARLISLAQSGSDIGNAAAQSASMLRANLGTAQNSANVNNLGDMFGGTAQTYRNMQDAAERRRGLQDATTYARAFSRG